MSSVKSLRSAAAVFLVVVLGLVATPTVAGARVAYGDVRPYQLEHQFDPPPIRDCGDIIHLVGVLYVEDGLAWSFKVVANDLRPWLGTASGTMEGTMRTRFAGLRGWGPVNASPSGGARTGLLQIADPYDEGFSVHAWINNHAGHAVCERWLTWGARPPRR